MTSDLGVQPAHEVALAAALGRAEASGHAAAPDAALISAETVKLALETRHLGLRYFNERLSVALKLMAVALGVFAAVGLCAMAWSASQDHAMVMEPFSTPQSFTQRGLTGQVLASDLMERLASMTRQANAQSVKTSSDVAAEEADQVKLEIPDTGVSISELWRAMRAWLGHERRIDGSVRETPDGRIQLVARIAGHDAATATGAPADLDKLEQAIAEQLFQAADPNNFVVYLDGAGRSSEAIAAVRQLTADAETPLDRASAFSLWANEVDPSQAIGLTDIALRLEPRLLPGYWQRMRAEQQLGRDEAALADARRLLALNDARLPAFLQGRGVEIIHAYARLAIDDLTGDYARGQQDELAGGDTPSLEPVRLSRYAAWRHDGALARSLLAEGLLSGQAPRLSVSISRYEVDAEAGDWSAAVADATTLIAIAEDLRLKATAPSDATTRAVAEATAYRPRLAEARMRTGDLAGAEAAIRETPLDCDRCLRERGRIAAAQGDLAAATGWFEAATRQNPSSPFAYRDWAEMLLSRGDAAGAIEKLKQAVVAGPNFADAQEVWAEALMRAGRAQDAVTHFARAEALAPSWGRIRLRWGEALAKLARRTEAQAQWRMANDLDLAPEERAELGRDLRRQAEVRS